MEPDDRPNPFASADAADIYKEWIRLCDDFVNLEGQCALLCELLASLSRRNFPLDSATKHGIDVFGNRLREQLATFKQHLNNARSIGG